MGKYSKYAIAENHAFVLLNVVRHKSDAFCYVIFFPSRAHISINLAH